jgi:hypothetical protein
VLFYAATAGRESAELVALSLGIQTEVPPQPTATPSLNAVAQLVPLHESSLPLVATVLTLTIEVSGEGLDFGSAGTVATTAFLPGTGVAVGQSLLSPGRGGGMEGDDGASPGETEESISAAVPTTISPWARWVIGLDKAMEQFLRENPDGIPGDVDRNDRMELPPTPSAPNPGGPTSWRFTPELLPSGGEVEQPEIPSLNLPTQAIDTTIESLWGDATGRERKGPDVAERFSDRSTSRVPTLGPLLRPQPPSLSPKSVGSEQTDFVCTASSLLDAGDRADRVSVPAPGAGTNEPIWDSSSLAISMLIVGWASHYRSPRNSRTRWPRRMGDPVRGRRDVID